MGARERVGRLTRAAGLAVAVTWAAGAAALATGQDLDPGRQVEWDLRGPIGASSALRALVSEGELGLYAEPDDPTRRIPLGPRGRGLLGGGWLPYATIRPSGPLFEGDTASAAGLHGLEPRYDLSRGLDVGAGLSWHLSQGLSLFGEYRLLPIRPAPAGIGDAHGREADGPELKGGVHIRF
jgi:hypothetical protein